MSPLLRSEVVSEWSIDSISRIFSSERNEAIII